MNNNSTNNPVINNNLAPSQLDTLVNLISEALIMIDTQGQLVLQNRAAESLLELDPDNPNSKDLFSDQWNFYLNRTEKLTPEFYFWKKALETNTNIEKHVLGFINSKKEFLWLEASSFPIWDPEQKNVTNVAITFNDITQRVQYQLEIEHQNNLLSAVNKATSSIIDVEDWPTALNQFLKELGLASKTSRIYVFQNYFLNEKLLTKQIAEWVNEGITPQINNPELQTFDYQETGFNRWQVQLSQNKIISGLVKNFPESEQQVLTQQNIKSIIVAPLFVNQQWWGFIGFDECQREIEWPMSIVSTLSSSAVILSLAIKQRLIQQEIKNNLESYKDKNEELEKLNKVMIGREAKMAELKEELSSLKGETI